MECVLRSPEIQSTFSYLGFMHADRYHVNENCNAALETILHNILTEDKCLRTYRRSINFGQNIQKDLIPLLIHAKDDKTIELLVTILVNLSIPTECLLSVEVTSQTGLDLYTIFEINQLLTTAKTAFTGPQATKVVVDFLKKNSYPAQPKVSPGQCTNISNCLLLLRNILHIPEEAKCPSRCNNGSGYSMQNQIIWNIFSQSIDKVLIKLIIIPEATKWAVTIVQLIALLYKDQHFVTLHKLLNIWLMEPCKSESSEDNESNTSPPYRGSEDSSLLLTSDPTSDASDTGGSEKSNNGPNSENNRRASTENTTIKDANQPFLPPLPDDNDIHMSKQHASTDDENMNTENNNKVITVSSPTVTTNDQQPGNTKKEAGISETSNFQDSISTSSTDDKVPSKKPVHQRPHNLKQRVNTKARTGVKLQERKRMKMVKRGKANIINVQGLELQTPTDNEISIVLKEFTIDFLLKGYNPLVRTLHTQILTNIQLEIDTSHFFWLITYFLKFATQIELDLLQTSAVLSFDIISYLTAEGVNLCEHFEMADKIDGNDLKPSSRRLNLVVTAIREFVQAIEVYKKLPHICVEDKDALLTLQNKMCETDELRSLLVLLLRRYNPKYLTKQYLQDLIVTNHILLTFVDGAMRSPDYTGSTNMADHIKQFAAPEIMSQYGLLLEDYAVNEEFVNDCVFTVMHHVAGELDSLTSLCQPKILKTFTSIWQSESEICDDWSDLIHYVINTFVKRSHTLLNIDNFRMDTQIFDVEKFLADRPTAVTLAKKDTQLAHEEEKTVILAKEYIQLAPEAEKKLLSAYSSGSQSSKQRWTKEALSTLSWIYLQCKTLPDVIGEILKRLKENGITKSRKSVIEELYKNKIINKEECERLSKAEIRDVEIGKLCEQLRLDGKTKCIDWVQQVLLETCYAKLQFEKKYGNECFTSGDQSDTLQFKLFNQEHYSPVMSPVSYHALRLNQPVPLVPWNCEQAAMCKDLNFVKLLHKLGFLMPVDTGKMFIRIPHVWSAEVLYGKAGRVAVIDTTKLKFSVTEISSCSNKSSSQQNSALPTGLAKEVTPLITAPDSLYKRHLAAIVNFTSRSGCSMNSDKNHEPNKHGWLKVVQRSRNLKLTCTTGSVLETVGLPPVEAAPAPAQHAAPSPGQPERTVPNDFIGYFSELKDKDSVSETASIALVITHKYVSADEDEKLEPAPRPSVMKAVNEDEKLEPASRSSVTKAVNEDEKLEPAPRPSVTKAVNEESSSDTEGGANKRKKLSNSF